MGHCVNGEIDNMNPGDGYGKQEVDCRDCDSSIDGDGGRGGLRVSSLLLDDIDRLRAGR